MCISLSTIVIIQVEQLEKELHKHREATTVVEDIIEVESVAVTIAKQHQAPPQVF